MIEVYTTGYPIRSATYGRPDSPPGDQIAAGFARPRQHPTVNGTTAALKPRAGG